MQVNILKRWILIIKKLKKSQYFLIGKSNFEELQNTRYKHDISKFLYKIVTFSYKIEQNITAKVKFYQQNKSFFKLSEKLP